MSDERTALERMADRPSIIGDKAAELLGRRRVLVGRYAAAPVRCVQCGEMSPDLHVVQVMGEADLCINCMHVAMSESYYDAPDSRVRDAS